MRSFSYERPERGVSELSRELGLHKSTVSRLMRTLEQGGLLSRDPESERYRLGIDLIGLAAQVVDYIDVRQVARPFLRALSDLCQETVNLSVVDAGRVINLEQFVPQTRRIRNVGQVGRRMCMHCTAAGKMFLAYLPPEARGAQLHFPLERFTARTLTEPGELDADLDRVCARGYAVAQEELEDGLNVIAAPVRDHTGHVVAAVSVAGPAYRITPGMFPELGHQLVDVAAKISEQLGYRV
ncbi:MAG: IclR family transcriptional regulator [Anaerolineae bacterium]|nr:IclR family transcriptional regulator [Anaerolineae bacterium]